MLTYHQYGAALFTQSQYYCTGNTHGSDHCHAIGNYTIKIKPTSTMRQWVNKTGLNQKRCCWNLLSAMSHVKCQVKLWIGVGCLLDIEVVPQLSTLVWGGVGWGWGWKCVCVGGGGGGGGMTKLITGSLGNIVVFDFTNSLWNNEFREVYRWGAQLCSNLIYAPNHMRYPCTTIGISTQYTIYQEIWCRVLLRSKLDWFYRYISRFLLCSLALE